MGTLATKIENAFTSIKGTYNRLGECDVEDVDIDDFASVSTSGISQKDYNVLKAALSEASTMETKYIAEMKKRNNWGKSLSSVSGNELVGNAELNGEIPKNAEPKIINSELDKY